MQYKLSSIMDEARAEELSKKVTAGIDIGSRASKAALLYKGSVYLTITPSGVSSIETGRRLLKQLVVEAGIEERSIEKIIGTGYGRVALSFDGIPFDSLTEITCHAKGAHYLNPDTRTIIDIGGQDSKAIKVNPENGEVIDFIMNDKCAAGTGRFLEKVAQLLDLSLEELGEYAARSAAPVEISSQCVVFAESEVISLKMTGSLKEDIAAGIHFANARRIQGLLRRIGFESDVVFTGGVSNNRGMRKALEEVIGVPIVVPKVDTTFAGALGAAIEAQRM